MAFRSAAARLPGRLATATETMERVTARLPRYLSDSKGRVLSEEELAKETVYIQKMERERLEKLRKKAEKEKAAAAAKEQQQKTVEPH